MARMGEGETSLVFEVQTPLGFSVRVTKSRWELIVGIKHPVMSGRESSVRRALESPDEVRRSRRDAGVLLFYATEATGRWVCAVVRQDDAAAVLVTAYPTDAIKEGDRVWPK